MGPIVFDSATPLGNEGDRSCSLLTCLGGEPLEGRATLPTASMASSRNSAGWGGQSAADNWRLPETLKKRHPHGPAL